MCMCMCMYTSYTYVFVEIGRVYDVQIFTQIFNISIWGKFLKQLTAT